MSEHYKFFQNKECEYFPCHKTEKTEDFNCSFAFILICQRCTVRRKFYLYGKRNKKLYKLLVSA